MKKERSTLSSKTSRRILALAVLSAGLFAQSPARADFNLQVVDGSGNPVSGFKWMLEEDNTDLTTPGTPRDNSASLVMHKSHAIVKATGSSAQSTTVVPCDSATRYMVSVLMDGYSLGGVNVAAGQTQATVVINANPLPTAQISILAFHDNNPINNVPDATEEGLGGFEIVLADYLGGPILTDAFGNPLGTKYQIGTNGIPVLDGNGAPVVTTTGNGRIYTDANGKAVVKYLPMGKYGVQCVPPTGSNWKGGKATASSINGAWTQTATIEGTPTVDAWAKANEPSIFTEGFGAGNYHVFFGFVDPRKTVWATNQPTPFAANVRLSGTLRFNHFGRPPNNAANALGAPVADAFVALNEINALGTGGRGLTIVPCDPATGHFLITNVPPGKYQLVYWDKPLNALFGINTITVPATNTDLGDIAALRWFGTYEGSVFNDANQNGFRDANEVGIPREALNIRFRDGSIYQSTLTDSAGDFAFNQVFPFFKWLVVENGFGRYKATGFTTVVDEGGIVPTNNGWAMPSENVRTPQPQFITNPDGSQDTNSPVINPNTGNNLSSTYSDPIAANNLLAAMMLFLNQNNRIDWGKTHYAKGENGGITGVLGYQNTRAELDPRDGTIDPWEPGVPRVQVALYQDKDADGVIDDLNGDGHPTPADVDNYPFGWSTGGAKGVEDVDHNGNGVFDAGDAIQITYTDSWDDNNPTGVQQPKPPIILGKKIIGNDNYATWNQIRPGVFDGGYAFTSYFPGGLANNATNEVVGLPVGDYIVQAFPPPNYLIQTEESFNVIFGNEYTPSRLSLNPPLVGTTNNHVGDLDYVATIVPSSRGAELFTVPAKFSMFPNRPDPNNEKCKPICRSSPPSCRHEVGSRL